jgi:hypothetical protein
MKWEEFEGSGKGGGLEGIEGPKKWEIQVEWPQMGLAQWK